MKKFLLLMAFLFTVTASAGVLSAFEPAAKWPSNQVRVCWMSSKIADDYNHAFDVETCSKLDKVFLAPSVMKAVQSVVELEYTPEKTGIYFTDWSECQVEMRDGVPVVSNADAAILLTEKPKDFGLVLGESSIGVSDVDYNTFHRVHKSPQLGIPVVNLDIPGGAQFNPQEKITDLLTFDLQHKESLEMTALHEFGHLAGLHHEHMAFYNESVKDPHCVTSGWAALFESQINNMKDMYPTEMVSNLILVKESRLSSYDSNSIMNYCQIFQMEASGLSFYATPVKGMKKVYSIHQKNAVLNDLQAHLADSTLYKISPAPTQSNPQRVKVAARIGLSDKDRAMLKSIYSKRQ